MYNLIGDSQKTCPDALVRDFARWQRFVRGGGRVGRKLTGEGNPRRPGIWELAEKGFPDGVGGQGMVEGPSTSAAIIGPG